MVVVNVVVETRAVLLLLIHYFGEEKRKVSMMVMDCDEGTSTGRRQTPQDKQPARMPPGVAGGATTTFRCRRARTPAGLSSCPQITDGETITTYRTMANEINENRTTMDVVQEIQDLTGKPHSHWIGNQWIPAEGSRLYTTDELKDIFSQECTLFVGDSLQRRAADTLNLMLSSSINTSHISDVKDSVFTSEYFFQTKHDRGFKRRTICMNNTTDNDFDVRMGCIDTDWRPLLADVSEFFIDYQNRTEIYKDYTSIVIGATIWDVVGSSRRRTSAEQLRNLVNETIYNISATIPSSVRVVWKSSGWCHTCAWTPVEGQLNHGDNYKVYAANDQARQSIQALNSSNIVYLDWAREILPRSLGADRLRSTDRNPYHYGLAPRLQFLQMLADVYDTTGHQHESMAAPGDIMSLATKMTLCDQPASDLLLLSIQARQLQSSTLFLVLGILILVPFLRMKRRVNTTSTR
jgi:hypothetical protein